MFGLQKNAELNLQVLQFFLCILHIIFPGILEWHWKYDIARTKNNQNHTPTLPHCCTGTDQLHFRWSTIRVATCSFTFTWSSKNIANAFSHERFQVWKGIIFSCKKWCPLLLHVGRLAPMIHMWVGGDIFVPRLAKGCLIGLSQAIIPGVWNHFWCVPMAIWYTFTWIHLLYSHVFRDVSLNKSFHPLTTKFKF